jgi:hypothetical protein
MVGIGPRVVKRDFSIRNESAKSMIFHVFSPYNPDHSLRIIFSHAGCFSVSQKRLRQQSKRCDSNSHAIVYGLAHLLTQPASDATLSRHHKPLCAKIHR